MSLLAVLGCDRGHLPDRQESARLELVKVGTIEPVHLCGRTLLAGQPAQEDLALLKERGVKTVISLRHAKEIDWDEQDAVTKQGMKYVNVPFSGEDELTDEVFDKLRTTLRNKENGPTALHCGSANRVGAIWYAYSVLDEGLSPEDAEREAEQVGLRSSWLLKRAQAYVEMQQKAEAPADP